MAEVISIVNQKGGCGKTVTAYELGTVLSLNGRSVLFIDLDGQGDLTGTLTDTAHKSGALEFIQGRAPNGLILPLSEKLDLMPATPALNSTDKKDISADRLSKALKKVRGQYDYIIIDTPPKLGSLIVNAIVGADTVLIPTLAESYSIDGLTNLLTYTYKGIRQSYSQLGRIGGIVVNRYSSRSIMNRSMMESIEQIGEAIGCPVFPVNDTVKMREAHYFNKSITEYAPKTATAKQIRAIVEYIDQ